MTQHRKGMALTGLSLLGILSGVAVLVVATSSQSRSVTSVHASLAVGRYAGELARSAMDETLAEFTKQCGLWTGGKDMREALSSRAAGGMVEGPDIFGVPSRSLLPRRTLALLKEEGISFEISPVTVRPLYYTTLENYGEVELSCHVSMSMGGRRTLHRRVAATHYFLLDSDSRTFRINTVAAGLIEDRSGS